MARPLVFTPNAWDEYIHWQSRNRATVERINALIRECQRDPFRGIGKPEPLKGDIRGLWSRRIDDTHRLVYRVGADDLEIIACRYHYGAR